MRSRVTELKPTQKGTTVKDKYMRPRMTELGYTQENPTIKTEEKE